MEKKIEQLYKSLYYYIKKRINNQLDAEDLTQEVFYKLYNSKSDKVENIKSWVYSIARNSIIDYYRKKKRYTEEVEDVFIQEEISKEDAVNELSNCIAPFIDQLPKDYISIMKLSEIENLSQKEIAKKFDMNYTTVRSKVQRGRIKLKELISDCCTVIQGGKGGIVDFKKNENCHKSC